MISAWLAIDIDIYKTFHKGEDYIQFTEIRLQLLWNKIEK